MNDSEVTLQELKNCIASFVKERDWDKYHPAKNLSMNIVNEAVELMEKFTWLTAEESEEFVAKDRLEIEHELSDILFGVLSFCVRYDIDISTAFRRKMQLNAQKYPIEKSYGKNSKYTDL